ncbi:MAG TPA: response regulator [Candidatus Limnocylindria bacterium]|nr:response regulator [Candidatus Limnocylindria bacterium]
MDTPFNILVAEDNEDDLFLLEQAFKKAAVTSRLYPVRDGYEALAYLKREDPYGDETAYPSPDIVLLDLNMPRVNGFEVLEWLRQQPTLGRLMVHVLTASCREDDVKRAYDLRANSFVVKPSRVDELVAFVTALHTWHRIVCLPPKL